MDKELLKELKAQENIDFFYFILEQIEKEIRTDNRSVLERLVDRQTGFDDEKHSEYIKSIKTCLRRVIRNKKFLGYDYSRDQKFLNEVSKIKQASRTT